MLGGSNGLGAWLVANLWLADGSFEVAIADIREPAQLDPRCSFHMLSYDGDALDLPLLETTDVLVVAVPIPAFALVAERILPLLSPGTLVIDVASVKQSPMELVELALPEGVGFIGTHPLFGHAVSSLGGQTVVVSPLFGDMRRRPRMASICHRRQRRKRARDDRDRARQRDGADSGIDAFRRLDRRLHDRRS